MKRAKFKHLSPELRREVVRLAARGKSLRVIGRELDVSEGTVRYTLRPFGGVFRPEQWAVSSFRLSVDERIEIAFGLREGSTLTAIAARLGRPLSTVSREVSRHGGRARYQPMTAHRAAFRSARRGKATKLATNSELRAAVVADLERWWSPQQIARRLRVEHPDLPEMWVSHETIYKSLYVQGRGELRRELARCLRTGRAQRRSGSRIETRGRIPGMVMISDRPAEIEDRAVPGHWEGDLILGKDNKSAIVTLVERSTRYVLLGKITDRRAETVREIITGLMDRLPEHLTRSLTWDQGSEMAQHRQFKVDTGIDVYFCDPHSPWQRGSNENTNGLLRQYFPKGTSLAGHSQDHLDAVAVQLNGRPRETLNWKTPAECLAELLALTD